MGVKIGNGEVEGGEWKDGKMWDRKLIIDIDVCISMIEPQGDVTLTLFTLKTCIVYREM